MYIPLFDLWHLGFLPSELRRSRVFEAGHVIKDPRVEDPGLPAARTTAMCRMNPISKVDCWVSKRSSNAKSNVECQEKCENC